MLSWDRTPLHFRAGWASVLKKSCCAGIAMAFGIGQGIAADLMRVAPAPYAPTPYTWTGWYFGGHFGYGGGTYGPGTNKMEHSADFIQSSATGFIGGYQFGYNFQTYNNI